MTLSTEQKNKSLYFLDIAKFICAILIVFLHTEIFISISPALQMGFRNTIATIAVPFFFTSTGYLLFAKLKATSENKQTAVFIKYVTKLSRLYLIYSAVYFVFILSGWIKNGFTYKNVIEYVYNFFIVGSYSTIWYLLASIVAILLAFLCCKFWGCDKGLKRGLIIATLLYAFGVAISSWYGAIAKVPAFGAVADSYYSVFTTVKNGSLFGFVFIMLGGLLQNINLEKKKFSLSSVLCMGVAFIFVVVEAAVQYIFNFATKGVDLKISLLPFTFFFFILIILLNKQYAHLEFFVNYEKVWLHFRKLSILIFLLQRIPLTILASWKVNSLIFTLVVLAITVALSEIIIALSNKIKFFKYLY